MSGNVHTIVLFPKIQADTAVAVYLLKSFGKSKYPDIRDAKIEFWTNVPERTTPERLESEGYLLIDLGGKYDHHTYNERHPKAKESVSTIIAQDLGVRDHPALKKVLQWAKRDDLEGKGTISSDTLDRAFGLSGLIMNLNRVNETEPLKTLNATLPLIEAHVMIQYKRMVLLPKLWEEMVEKGDGETFYINNRGRKLKIAYAKTDDTALAGFLRQKERVGLVIQERSTGHKNFVTNQMFKLDLRPLVAEVRLAEARKKGLDRLGGDISMAGRVDEVPEWYYDTAANTLQNGGINPEGVVATKLEKNEIVEILRKVF